ncbi:MAG: HAD-IA family hydrolase [Candidatus Omnitrophica bacterium]|jgi:phosphoglycolate phosphatase|nr:HAD-IA family hydrolase [Candidatus Omnitrophota bacterium]
MKYDLILFDLDGTLLDTAPDIMASANWVMRQTGYPERDLTEVKHAIGRGVHELLNQLSESPDRPALEGEALERACEIYREHYVSNLVVFSKPYAGVIEMLEGPLKAARKGIVTNKPHALTGRLLKEVGLDGIFDPVIGTGWKYAAKPSAEGVDAAMAAHGVRAERVILIGDSEIDRQTAVNAGINFGWVSYGYDTVTRDGSFCVFDDPRQWEELTHGNV